MENGVALPDGPFREVAPRGAASHFDRFVWWSSRVDPPASVGARSPSHLLIDIFELASAMVERHQFGSTHHHYIAIHWRLRWLFVPTPFITWISGFGEWGQRVCFSTLERFVASRVQNTLSQRLANQSMRRRISENEKYIIVLSITILWYYDNIISWYYDITKFRNDKIYFIYSTYRLYWTHSIDLIYPFQPTDFTYVK